MKRLLSVDILRAIAAFAVIATHIQRPGLNTFDLNFIASLPLDFGFLGVYLFIVVSRFCIHLGYARHLSRGHIEWSWTHFWKRRFIRLYPTYIISIIFSLSVAYLLAYIMGMRPNLPGELKWDLITHLCMIHNLIVDYSTGLGNPPFWSLGLEEQLYVLFAVVVLLRSKRMSIIGILWIALAVSICWGIVTVLFETSSSEQIGLDLGVVVIGNLKDWPFGYWFIWLLGAVAAEVYLGLIIIPSWLTSRWMIISATVLTIITNTRTRGRYAQFWLPYDGVFVQTLLLVIVRLNPLIFSVGCFAVLLRLTAAEKAGHINNRLSKIVGGIGLTTYSLYPNPLPYS